MLYERNKEPLFEHSHAMVEKAIESILVNKI